MRKLKGLLFDNDGTIVDTHDLILASMQHATRDVLGREIPDEQLMAQVGIPLADQMDAFTPDPDEQRRLLETYRAFNHERHDDSIALFEGEEEALARIAASGLRMGVVTSKMRWLCQRGLDVLGIAPYFEFVLGADDTPAHKPLPDPILAGCFALGLAPHECAYVGDAIFDIQAANAAGCTSIAVTWGMGSPEALAAVEPDITVATWAELADLF